MLEAWIPAIVGFALGWAVVGVVKAIRVRVNELKELSDNMNKTDFWIEQQGIGTSRTSHLPDEKDIGGAD